MPGLEPASRVYPTVVPRPVLHDRLSEGLRRGVVLVSAPAGSGKTVLIRSWVDTAGLRDRTAWVTVERDERDGQHFWLAVIDALRSVTGIGGPIEDLGPSPQFDGTAVVERLASSARSLDETAVLVVDDLHELLDPAAMGELDLLLARRPPLLGVVLATRHDPPLGLHRLRLSGELIEVRAAELRFGREESAQLLAAAGVEVSQDSIGALLSRTEGWAAGLRLAALSLTGRRDPDHFVATFSGSDRAVADYLFAEVLERQPEPARRLLVRTSILERVNGALADRLLGTSGSERILLGLEDASAFVVSIDPERSWFRYHRLFADLLRLELRRSDPGSIPALHRVAAEWFAEHASPVEAIRHAQAAEDWRFAADLLGSHGFSLALDGSYATITALLEPFPPDAFASPELAAFLAYGEVIRPSLETAEAYIAIAERHAAEVPEERRQRFAAMLATARLTLARWRGDAGTLTVEARAVLEPPAAASVADVAVANDVRAVGLMSLGIVELWAGSGDDAERHLGQAIELARRNGRPYVEMGSLGHLAVALGRRSVSAMLETALQAIAMIERYGWLSEPVTPMVLAAVGTACALRGELDGAGAWLDRAEGAIRPNAEPAKELMVRYARGLQRLGQARLREAAELFGETRRLQSAMVDPDPLAISARGLLAQCLVRLGDLPGAREAIEVASDAERASVEVRGGLAAIRLAEGDIPAALDALASLDEAPRIHDFSLANALVVRALARTAAGEQTAAEDDVEQALDLAEADHLILPFLITPARGLLERHPRHRTAHAALLADILDVLAGSAPPHRRVVEPVPLAEELTETELRVLRYLPSNLTAPEIAAEMFLSVSTVKTHMRHIYEKLGAHTRTEAVDRAREHGLLGPARGRGPIAR